MGKKLNVCLVNDSFPPLIDGVANTVVNYAGIINNGLGRASVVTPFYPEADDAEFEYPVIRIPSINTTKLVGYRTGFTFDPLIMRRLEDSNFDIIHSHCPVTSTFLARTLRENIDVPVVLTYHTKFDIDIRNSIKGGLLQEGAIKLLASNVSACDEIWAVSRGAGENLRSLGFRGDIFVMPNGVDFPRGRVTEKEINAAAEGFDLPYEVPVFLFVGRIMWYKGIRIILDALKGLKDMGKDFRMVFIGKGQDKEDVMAYSVSLGLNDKVIFAPPVYDRDVLRAWYCRADLFLFPSTFDTNGLVVREAAACSLASVLVKGSCAAEDTGDRENCLLIEENAESLKSVLLDFGFDIPGLRKLGENASLQLYSSWEDSVKRAYDRYGYVIEKYKTGAYTREREERSRVIDHAGDMLFRTSADAIEQFVRMEREADRLMIKTWTEVQEIKADYRLLKGTINDLMEDILERML